MHSSHTVIKRHTPTKHDMYVIQCTACKQQAAINQSISCYSEYSSKHQDTKPHLSHAQAAAAMVAAWPPPTAASSCQDMRTLIKPSAAAWCARQESCATGQGRACFTAAPHEASLQPYLQLLQLQVTPHQQATAVLEAPRQQLPVLLPETA